jgi:CP family cyanate transporter-like MFS transporter
VFQLGLLGLVLLPGAGFLWALVVGFTIGAMFPLVLTLPLDMAELPEQVGAVAAMMLGVGYLIAGASPFVLGSVRDATGSFTVGLWLIAAAGGLYLIASLALVRPRDTARAADPRARPRL